MDMAYEGDETRGLASLLGFKRCPAQPSATHAWKLDKAFIDSAITSKTLPPPQGFRRVFTRYDKLDVLFRSFITSPYLAPLI